MLGLVFQLARAAFVFDGFVNTIENCRIPPHSTVVRKCPHGPAFAVVLQHGHVLGRQVGVTGTDLRAHRVIGQTGRAGLAPADRIFSVHAALPGFQVVDEFPAVFTVDCGHLGMQDQ